MKTMLVTVNKFADVEVVVDEARTNLIHYYGYPPEEVRAMTDEEAVEAYVSDAEGRVLDLCFDRTIKAVTVLQEET